MRQFGDIALRQISSNSFHFICSWWVYNIFLTFCSDVKWIFVILIKSCNTITIGFGFHTDGKSISATIENCKDRFAIKNKRLPGSIIIIHEFIQLKTYHKPLIELSESILTISSGESGSDVKFSSSRILKNRIEKSDTSLQYSLWELPALYGITYKLCLSVYKIRNGNTFVAYFFIKLKEYIFSQFFFTKIKYLSKKKCFWNFRGLFHENISFK